MINIEAMKQVLKMAYDYFEACGIEPILFGHTLLFAYREKEFVDKPNKIIDIGCLQENLDKRLIDKFKDDGFFRRYSGGNLKYPLIYFEWKADQTVISVELLPLYYHNNKRGFNLASDEYHQWPEEYLLPYGQIEFLGNTYRAPNNIEKWLETYYGKTWNVPDKSFTWHNAPNRGKVPEGVI